MIFILYDMNNLNYQYGIEYINNQLITLKKIKKKLKEKNVSNDKFNRKISIISLLFIKYNNFVK